MHKQYSSKLDKSETINDVMDNLHKGRNLVLQLELQSLMAKPGKIREV